MLGRGVEIAFETKQLRDVCESQKNAERRMTLPVAEALRACLADLGAASNVSEFRLVRVDSKDTENGTVVVAHLADGIVLQLHQNHIDHPVSADGSTDWSQVSRVKIMSIGHA
jgi:toxin HigB-1